VVEVVRLKTGFFILQWKRRWIVNLTKKKYYYD